MNFDTDYWCWLSVDETIEFPVVPSGGYLELTKKYDLCLTGEVCGFYLNMLMCQKKKLNVIDSILLLQRKFSDVASISLAYVMSL